MGLPRAVENLFLAVWWEQRWEASRPRPQGRCVGPQGPAGERTSQLPGFSSPPASLPFAILTLVNAPYKRGFYCGDDSIRYPYRPDTITHGVMAGVTTTATVVLVRQEGLRGAGTGTGWAQLYPGGLTGWHSPALEVCGGLGDTTLPRVVLVGNRTPFRVLSSPAALGRPVGRSEGSCGCPPRA